MGFLRCDKNKERELVSEVATRLKNRSEGGKLKCEEGGGQMRETWKDRIGSQRIKRDKWKMGNIFFF